MDRQLEKIYGFLYMATKARLLYAKKYNNGKTVKYMKEDWLVKMTEFAEMAKSICLIRERPTTIFVNDWKPFKDFLLKMEKLVIYRSDN